MVVAVQLVAVERHAGLEPERVAGAQPDRHAVRGADAVEQRVPQLAGPRGLDEDLEAVLAGVAGPRDQRRDARDAALGDRVVAQGVEVDVGQRREDLASARALDRDEAGRQRAVVEDRPEAGSRRSASASETTAALPALATTRNRSSARR